MTKPVCTPIENGVQFPVLYTRDKKGKARGWTIWTEGDKMITEYGLVTGKKTRQERTAKPMNVGKSNETTAESQAILEAESKWLAQRDRKDYNEDIDKAGKQIRPMLAEDYHKTGARHVDFTSHVVQPKLDGLRLVYGPRWREDDEMNPGPHPYELISREGEVYNTPHIEQFAKPFLDFIKSRYPDCWALDGEIYLHGLPLETIVSYARKYKQGETETLEYHLFDLVMPERPFREREQILREMMLEFDTMHEDSGIGSVMFIVDSEVVNSEDEMLALQGGYVGMGFEGTMVRNAEAVYEVAHRSKSLHKYKDHDEKEFKIIDVWEDQNGNAMFHCALDDVSEVVEESNAVTVTDEGVVVFGCTPKRTHEERKKMLTEPEKYIGKWVTVKHFGRTMENVPKFPVGLNLRECDEQGNPIY